MASKVVQTLYKLVDKYASKSIMPSGDISSDVPYDLSSLSDEDFAIYHGLLITYLVSVKQKFENRAKILPITEKKMLLDLIKETESFLKLKRSEFDRMNTIHFIDLQKSLKSALHYLNGLVKPSDVSR